MQENQNLGKTKAPEKEKHEERNERGILSVLIQELRCNFGPALKEIEVKDVRIGLAYTGVMLSDCFGGVACTPLYDFSCCLAVDFPETLKTSTTDYILELALSENSLEAVVGIATINALFSMLQGQKLESFPASDVDILDLIKPEDKVAMVGYFGPLVPKILKITDKLTVLERRKIKAPEVRTLPSEKAGEVLPVSDVIILSASTLVNRTFDGLLAQKRDAREVVLLGPSAPLYPEPFFKRGITAVMGTQILDPWKMLTVISEAGGTKKLHQYCGEKVAFRKNRQYP
jgi:uncharacterized protein (DUF4213/DUF364 family)